MSSGHGISVTKLECKCYDDLISSYVLKFCVNDLLRFNIIIQTMEDYKRVNALELLYR